MRIAIFSDVHGNLPALEAVYTHLQKQKTDSVYCLGDLVNQNVWNNEVGEFINEHHIPCVLGNHDEGIGNNRARFPFAYGSDEELSWGLEAIAYTLKQVTEENKKILRSFPLKISLEVETAGQKRKIVFTHGTPSSNAGRIYRFYKQEDLTKIMDKENADILLIGNTHEAFHKIMCSVIDGRLVYKHIINPGSVGFPRDGSWHACYAIVSIDLSKDLKYDTEAFHVDFFRLDYDINKTIKALQKSPLSTYYAGRLLRY